MGYDLRLLKLLLFVYDWNTTFLLLNMYICITIRHVLDMPTIVMLVADLNRSVSN